MATRQVFCVILKQNVQKSDYAKKQYFTSQRNISVIISDNKQSNFFNIRSHGKFYKKHYFSQFRFLGSSGSKVDKEFSKKQPNFDFPEQQIKLYTCDDLYKKWREKRKFWTVPKSGVYATITYVDTMIGKKNKDNKINENSPTVLCIHGIPGNYGVFSHLITEFANNGIRAVVPNFPNVLYLPGKSNELELFRHSVEEKTQVFEDFLKSLNISKLDAIVAHSSAIYPALRLALNPKLNVKCQILFNTGGHKKTVTMKPFWIIWSCSYLYLHPWGRKFVQKTGKFIMKYIMRSPIKDDNFDGIMLLAITMTFSEYWKAKDQFEEIVKRRFPTLLCFSEDDKVVERKLTYEVISLLGASQQNISYFDECANLKIKGEDKTWLRILSFEKGSHYVFRKHFEICNQEALHLMRKHIGICTDNRMDSSSEFSFNFEKQPSYLTDNSKHVDKCSDSLFVIRR